MPDLIVAHDYICPWCWVGWQQGKRLRAEFPGMRLIWKGYELMPEGLEDPPAKPKPDGPKKPPVPSRFQLLLAAEGMVLPRRTRPFSRSRRALEGAEFALEHGLADAYHESLYHGYWDEDLDIADRGTLRQLAARAGLDPDQFDQAMDDRVYRDTVVEYDDPAHAAGIWNVPTWQFPEQWIAEQPYTVVREYAQRFIGSAGG